MSRIVRSLPLSSRELDTLRPDLPMRFFRHSAADWSDSEEDLVKLEPDAGFRARQLAIIPFGAKGGALKAHRITDDGGLTLRHIVEEARAAGSLRRGKRGGYLSIRHRRRPTVILSMGGRRSGRARALKTSGCSCFSHQSDPPAFHPIVVIGKGKPSPDGVSDGPVIPLLSCPFLSSKGAAKHSADCRAW